MPMRRWALCVGAVGCLVAIKAEAQTQAQGTTNPQCVAAYEEAQVDKKWGRLRAAHEHLLACAGAACPNWMQKECQVWLEDVERATPTVVLSAVVDGEERTRVQVDLDGKPWVEEISPRAMGLELGEHVLTFKIPGYPPVEKKVLLSEGEKLKRVRVDIEKPKPAGAAGKVGTDGAAGSASTQPREVARPIPLGVWILGGVAVASIGTSVILGVGANDEEKRLKNTCSPACSDSDVDGLQGRFTATNVAVGVGIAAAVGAVTWYFLRPSGYAQRSSVGLLSNGGSLRFEF